MLDITVLEKIQNDDRVKGALGYFAYANQLPLKIRRALDRTVVARANELCFGYEDLVNYVLTEDSMLLCVSAARGLQELDYLKLPSPQD